MDALPPFDLIGYPHVVQLLEALAKLEIDYAIVATDTIVSPTTTAALDRIVSLQLELVGEVSAEETVCLCALPGTKLRDADCVMSDQSLLSRCEEYILQLEGLHKQDILRHVTWDSVTACRIVREEQAQNTLVLCSRRAVVANGLAVLVDRAATSQAVSAYTVIGRRHTPPLPFEGLASCLASPPARRQWTVLLFTSDRPHLMALLRPFAYLNLDIQHFIIRNKSGDSAWYVFFC
jgi:prephenate dehydratase